MLLARSSRVSVGDMSGLCNRIPCLFACLSVLAKVSNNLFFLQYKAAEVRVVVFIRYGSKEKVQGFLLVAQYILS